MKPEKNNEGKQGRLKARQARMSDLVRRVKGDERGAVRFYLRGSRPAHYSVDGYQDGHEKTNWLVMSCVEAGYRVKKKWWGCPGSNVTSYEVFYPFLDGGLALYSGNYLFCDPCQGTYLYGFRALRWALKQLGCRQPRKLVGETRLRLVPPVAAKGRSGVRDSSSPTAVHKEVATTTENKRNKSIGDRVRVAGPDDPIYSGRLIISGLSIVPKMEVVSEEEGQAPDSGRDDGEE